MRPRDASRVCLCVSASSEKRPGREAACGPPQAANVRHGLSHAGEAPKERKEMYHPQGGGKRSRTVKSVAWGRSGGGWETRGRSGAKSPYRSTRGRLGDPYKACKDRPRRRDRPQTRSVGPYDSEWPESAKHYRSVVRGSGAGFGLRRGGRTNENNRSSLCI